MHTAYERIRRIEDATDEWARKIDGKSMRSTDVAARQVEATVLLVEATLAVAKALDEVRGELSGLDDALALLARGR
jgi:hypothetical protein